MCTWTNLFLFGNASWIIGSGSTKPPYNGPSTDHTQGKMIRSNKNKVHIIVHYVACPFSGTDQGQYLILSSLFTNKQTFIAVMQSETFSATTSAGRCLTFWYVIRGSGLGRIDVNITTSDSTTMIWSLGTEDQGIEWKYASVGYYINSAHEVRSPEIHLIKIDRIGSFRSLSKEPFFHKCKVTMLSMILMFVTVIAAQRLSVLALLH
jgi:hypothetical protein